MLFVIMVMRARGGAPEAGGGPEELSVARGRRGSPANWRPDALAARARACVRAAVPEQCEPSKLCDTHKSSPAFLMCICPASVDLLRVE
jgi:hypothetical protein